MLIPSNRGEVNQTWIQLQHLPAGAVDTACSSHLLCMALKLQMLSTVTTLRCA